MDELRDALDAALKERDAARAMAQQNRDDANRIIGELKGKLEAAERAFRLATESRNHAERSLRMVQCELFAIQESLSVIWLVSGGKKVTD